MHFFVIERPVSFASQVPGTSNNKIVSPLNTSACPPLQPHKLLHKTPQPDLPSTPLLQLAHNPHQRPKNAILTHPLTTIQHRPRDLTHIPQRPPHLPTPPALIPLNHLRVEAIQKQHRVLELDQAPPYRPTGNRPRAQPQRPEQDANAVCFGQAVRGAGARDARRRQQAPCRRGRSAS